MGKGRKGEKRVADEMLPSPAAASPPSPTHTIRARGGRKRKKKPPCHRKPKKTPKENKNKRNSCTNEIEKREGEEAMDVFLGANKRIKGKKPFFPVTGV
jgi:hypothetical protein